MLSTKSTANTDNHNIDTHNINNNVNNVVNMNNNNNMIDDENIINHYKSDTNTTELLQTFRTGGFHNYDSNNRTVLNGGDQLLNTIKINNLSSIKPTHNFEPVKNSFSQIPIQSVKHVQKFNNFTPEQSNRFNQNTTNQTKILVKFDKYNQRFYLYSSYNKEIGSFNVDEFIKTFCDQLDVRDHFLQHVNPYKFKQSRILIKNFIGQISFDDKDIKIKLLDHHQSPFMRDLQLLINLNNCLHKFEKGRMVRELMKVDEKYRVRIKKTLYKLINVLLNHTLHIISLVSQETKTLKKRNINHNLLDYSIGIIYRIGRYSLDEIERLKSERNRAEAILNTSNKIKETILSKLEKLEDKYGDKHSDNKRDSESYRDKDNENKQEGGSNDDSDYRSDGSDESRIITLESNSDEQLSAIYHF